ncbi:MAG: mechanosensitive ion channel domain-containing protein [Methylosarcina sp.]
MKVFVFPSMHIRNLLSLPLIFLLMFSANLPVTAADSDHKPKNSAVLDISKESLKARIEAIKTRQGLEETQKTKLLAAYQVAEDNLTNIDKFTAQAADYMKAIKVAPEQTKKLLREIEFNQQKQAKQKFEDFNRIPTEELEQRLILEKGKVSNLDEQTQKKEADLVLQNSRPKLIREEILVAQQDIDEAQKKLGFTDVSPESKLELEANQFQLKTLIDSKTAELKMLEAEAASNPARIELLKAESRLMEVQKNELGPIIAAIENLLTERRQQEAKEIQDALSQAERELSGKHPLIQNITRENIQFSRDLQTVTAKIEKYAEQKNKFDTEASEIENDFKSAEKKISLAGLSPALGRILREQRRNLTSQDNFALQTENIQEETASTSLEQLGIEEKLKEFIDIDNQLKELMRSRVDNAMPLDQRMMIQAELRVLLNSQKDVLNKLSIAYTTYLRTLGDIDFARQQLLNQAGKFADFLDERLLWVPSSEPINSAYPLGLYHSMQWLLSPSNWKSVIEDAVRISIHNLFLSILAFLGLFLLRSSKNWAKRQLIAISNKVEKIYTDNFYYTCKALACTVVLVSPLPLLIYFFGWFLSGDLYAADFIKAVGEGLQSASVPMFLLQFFYRLFAPAGIANNHFQWQKSNSELLRKQIAWLRFIAVPGIFIIYCTGASKISLYGDSLGRLALIVMMIAMAVFFSRLLKPDDGLLQSHIKSYPQGWVNRSRYIWYPATLLIPLVVIGFATAGYYLSALELQQKIIVTLRWSFLLIIIYDLVIRWLTLINRQLALKNARQKRKAATQSDKSSGVGGEEPIVPVEEQLIDIPKINAQTIKLLNVFTAFSVFAGFWIIWKNILPAFSFLERIELWRHVVKIDNQEIYQPITMANLMLAGLYIFITVVSVRNFSGVMEILVFRRWSIEAGERYAVIQLAKYFLIAIGFISVANELGGSWSEVQWLVAALGVGLGFGLQEIFANLVSGIILLFERPIRIGDTVTIGDVTGKVSRIQMRATTLIDWDQKELIVPNKTFITSQLVNWSLSDAITRIVIPVGIAYDSDVEFAHKVMMETVKATPKILADPAPSVVLIGFGENSLQFSIRIFVNELSDRLPVTHDLHVRLEKALKENHISIPYPHRDVYVHQVGQAADAFVPGNKLEKGREVSPKSIVL